MFLTDVVLMLAVAFAGLMVGRLLRIPPMVSYLVCGVLAGPGGFGLLHHSEAIDQLAELGVALLLFGIGIEFSLERLRRTLPRLVASGATQVVVTVVVAAGGARALGLSWPAAVTTGFLVSLSSTAMVFKLYQDSGELEAPQGQAATGILLFQDLALVPMMMLMPVLGGPMTGALSGGTIALLQAAAAVTWLLVLARALLPRGLALVARVHSPELFPLIALLIAFGMALGANALGLSLPIGAFLAGLALSGSPYSHQVFAELLPLRDAFIAVFFTSVGVIFEPAVVISHASVLVVMTLGVLAKALVCGLVVGIGWRSLRLGILAGLGLAQIGEFSLVLSREAVERAVVPASLEQALIGTAILTMAATPFAIAWARRLTRYEGAPSPVGSDLASHVVVIGLDRTGQAVARVLQETKIPFVAVDMTPENVKAAAKEGIPARFGDASRRAVLDDVGAPRCRAAVVAVSDPTATRRIVSLTRTLNPHARILVRAHTVDEIDELERLGADEVVPAEFEASIELFGRLLTHLGVPRHVARLQESIIRLGNYRTLRGAGPSRDLLLEIERVIRAGILETAEVLGGSAACGRTIGELRLREGLDVQVLSLVRSDKPVTNPNAETVLEPGDLVVLYGNHAAIAKALDLLDPSSGSSRGAGS